MRICYLGNASNIHIIRRASFMAARGHDVHVVSLRTCIIPKVHVHLVKSYHWMGKLNYLLKLRGFIAIINELKPDILDIQYLTSSGFIGNYIDNIPLVATAWGSDVLVTAKKYKFFAKTVKDICEKSERVISVSQQITQELTKLGIEEAKIETFPIGVDLTKFPPKTVTENSASLTILSTRHHEPIYNLELLIDAIPSVLSTLPNAKFIIAGDGSRRTALENKVRRLGLSSNVAFCGIVEHSKLAELYCKADIYVSTAISDGSSESLFEAFAVGAFPIVTAIPANDSWISDGINGWLVPVNQPEVLARKIIQASESPTLLAHAAGFNYELVSTQANFSQNMRRLEAIYNECSQK